MNAAKEQHTDTNHKDQRRIRDYGLKGGQHSTAKPRKDAQAHQEMAPFDEYDNYEEVWVSGKETFFTCPKSYQRTEHDGKGSHIA
mmetsp:Transcript_59014/g.104865  ORF Transcript_59014/g.104865 Transcript_59014/m.104865 type:complete len:85 (+) Transcript_59014:632-886(+)